MANIELAVSFAENVARDDSHGYDQNDRIGTYGNYDCSGLVIMACEYAGYPVRSKYGANTTRNMYSTFKKAGAIDVTAECDLNTMAGLKRGDILLNRLHHTAFYCGSGNIVCASINELGKTTGGKSGDQTGHEIEIKPYYNYPWTDVLRFISEDSLYNLAMDVIRGYYGNGAFRRQKLTQLGYNYREVQDKVNEIMHKNFS